MVSEQEKRILKPDGKLSKKLLHFHQDFSILKTSENSNISKLIFLKL
jgi:hypothetical protein